MSGLHDLLELAAGEPTTYDVSADLRRGRRAVARRRTHWAVGAAGSLVAASAVGVTALPHGGGVDVVQPGDGAATEATPPPTGPTDVDLRYYDVPQPPPGWHVVGERPQYVMITRDGSGVTSVDSGFVGQIVVMLTSGDASYDEIFDQPSVPYDGRTFHSNGTTGGAGMTTLSVRTADGSWLQVQYPYADFSVTDMAAYLDGVVVKQGAAPADQPTGHRDFRVIHKGGLRYVVPGKGAAPAKHH